MRWVVALIAFVMSLQSVFVMSLQAGFCDVTAVRFKRGMWSGGSPPGSERL
uniref:Uncharacterized protein n=1 Tax=Anguilla anguilla TaxID=7936 RepID=A0A0E9V7R8_ANGAN